MRSMPRPVPPPPPAFVGEPEWQTMLRHIALLEHRDLLNRVARSQAVARIVCYQARRAREVAQRAREMVRRLPRIAVKGSV